MSVQFLCPFVNQIVCLLVFIIELYEFFFFLIGRALKILFIYLFLAVLGLPCCAWAFSSCSKRGLLFLAVHVLLIVVASLVAEHRL